MCRIMGFRQMNCVLASGVCVFTVFTGLEMLMSNIQYKMLVAEIANHQCTFLSSMYVTSYISLDNFLCINFPQTKAGKCSKAWHGPGEMTEGTRTGAVGAIKELGFSGLHK